MYQVGETVLYGTEGVCKVAEICEMKMGSQKGRYYVLRPVYRVSATIYVPLTNETLVGRMKRVLSVSEVNTLLKNAAAFELPWIEDPNERKQSYSRILIDGDRREVVGLVRVLYLQRESLTANGRRMRASDDQILRDAEKLLNDEFALVLQIPQQEVPEYIRAHIEA